MDGTFSGPQDPAGSPSSEELALVLQKVLCPIGLVPAELAKQLDALTCLVGLQCVKAQVQSSGGEDVARALTLVVRQAVARLDEGAARTAADLLLGLTRTRGLPRKDRRKDAADTLVVGEAHFRKHREFALLREVAEEICALELEHRENAPVSAGQAMDPDPSHATPGRGISESASGQRMEPGLRDLRVLLPDPVASFTGRSDELRWLAQATMERVVVTQALVGLGGVGKTALALEYAHRCVYAAHSVDLAWWFSASDRLTLSAAMARLYEDVAGVPSGADSVLAAGRLRNWLESSPYRWLIVFDNADDPRILDGLVPHAGVGQVLITSRRADWSQLGAMVRRLEVLSTDDAVALLRTLTGRDDDEGAHLLARELDGLAAALQQAGAFVRKTGWDYKRYVEMLQARPLSIHGEDLADIGTTLAKVWESSLDQATRSGRDGTLTLDVLGVLSYFAAEDIPRWLLEPPGIDSRAILRADDPLAVELALVGLADYSLVGLDADGIGLHRLVQHLTRAHVEAPDGAVGAVTHVAMAMRLLLGALAGPGPTTGRVQRLLPHVCEAAAHAVRLSAVPEETVSVLNIVAEDRLDLGQIDIAHTLVKDALRMATGSLDPDHPGTLRTRSNLARSLGEGGSLIEAVAEFQALLEDRRRVLGPDHPDTLRARHNLACWLGPAGKVDDAVSHFRAVLEDQRRVLGPDHPETLSTLSSLAYWLGEKGSVEESLVLLEGLLENQRRVLGADHGETLSTRSSLARRLGQAGHVEEAVAQFQAVLEDCQRVLGPNHPATLRTRSSLARWLGEAGRVNEAVAQLQVLLEDRRRLLGPNHPATLRTRSSLARWLGEMGRVDEAVRQLQVLLEHQRRTLGPDHPDTLRARRNLARWLGEMGRVDEAVAQSQTLLEDRRRVFGPDHPATLRARRNLAWWLGATGKADEAVMQLEALLSDDLRVLGPDHVDTLETRHTLATVEGRVGRVDEAVAHLQSLLEDDLRVLGPDHPATTTTRNTLVSLLGETGEANETDRS